MRGILPGNSIIFQFRFKKRKFYGTISQLCFHWAFTCFLGGFTCYFGEDSLAFSSDFFFQEVFVHYLINFFSAVRFIVFLMVELIVVYPQRLNIAKMISA